MTLFGAVRIRACLGDLALACGAAVLTMAVGAGQVTATLRGAFVDPDDAMRLAEVRAWLGGQPWFDMNARRLDPPFGSVLHWSRLVDLPAAGAIRVFGLFVAPDTAERLAAVAVPGVWLALLFAGMLRLARLVVGPDTRITTLLGTFLSGATLVQFAAGRIGHHAPETVALVFATGFVADAFDPRRARSAVVAGVLVALSLAMSLETLPFLAVLSALVVASWIRRGAAAAPMLACFTAGLLVALPLFFVVTVGPSRWLLPVCDAYGAAHFGASMIGAAGSLALALLSRRLASWSGRLAGAAAVAGAVVTFVALAYPACLHSPFAGVDPLVRTLWLDHVVESLPLPAFVRTHPMLGLAIVLPMAGGVVSAVAGSLSSRGVAAERLGLVASLAAAGLALGFWQVRVLGSVAPLALCGGIWAIDRLRHRFAGGGLPLAAAMAPVAIIVFGTTFWVLALPVEAPESRVTAACLQPEAFTPLAALPPGTVVAPLDLGSHLIEATRLSPFAAPYHRNDDGNRFALSVFLAKPEAAAAMLDQRKVTYVVTCPGMSELNRLATRAPDGLAGALTSDHVPAFLRPLALDGTPLKVYATQPRTN